jgi:hypothetical protein
MQAFVRQFECALRQFPPAHHGDHTMVSQVVETAPQAMLALAQSLAPSLGSQTRSHRPPRPLGAVG